MVTVSKMTQKYIENPSKMGNAVLCLSTKWVIYFYFWISKICLLGSLFHFKEHFDTINTFKIMYQNDALCVVFIRKKNDITLGDQVSSQKERQLCLYFSSPRRDC